MSINNRDFTISNTSYSVSVISYAGSKNKINNIIENFSRQNLLNKELIIVYNSILDLEDVKKDLMKTENISFFGIQPMISKGAYLNFGIKECKKNYIAIFNENDYYGANYLSNCMRTAVVTKATIMGKSLVYIYFKDIELLGVFKEYYDHGWDNAVENSYTSYVREGTLFIKRTAFTRIGFPDDDLYFCSKFFQKCRDQHIKIYAADRSDYVYIFQNNKYECNKFSKDYVINKCSIITKTNDLSYC